MRHYLVNGSLYLIPDVWFVGFLRTHPGATLQGAMEWWDRQARWER